MDSRKLAGAGVVVGAATTVTALLLGSTAATATESHHPESHHPESAFAFSTMGLLPIGPLVQVSSSDGRAVHGELADLTSVPAAALNRFSSGKLTSDVQEGLATTSVANLQIATLLTGDLIKTTCENGRGRVELTNGKLVGSALPATALTNQMIDFTPYLRVTFGEETRNGNGSITVTGVKVALFPNGALPDGTVPTVLPTALPTIFPTAPSLTSVVPTTLPPTTTTAVTTTPPTSTTSASLAPVALAVPLVDTPATTTTAPPPTTTVTPTTTTVPPTTTTVPPTTTTVPPPTTTPPATTTPPTGVPLVTITVGSATCRRGHGNGSPTTTTSATSTSTDSDDDSDDDSDHTSSDSSDDSDDATSPAPAPTVIDADLPVTG